MTCPETGGGPARIRRQPRKAIAASPSAKQQTRVVTRNRGRLSYRRALYCRILSLGRRLIPGNRRNETVALFGQGLNEPWCFGGVAQRLTQAIDGIVKTVVEVNERIGWPKLLVDLLTRD